MKKSLIIPGIALCAMSHAVIIDDFSSGFAFHSTTVDFNYGANDGSVPGGVRSVDHDFHSNPLNRTVQTDLDSFDPGNFYIEAGTMVNATVNLYYGGGALQGTPTDRPLDFPDFNGFGLLDLSSESAFKISYEGNDQSSTGLVMRVFDGTNTSTYAGTTIAEGDGMVIVPFADFTGSADFSKLDKIHLGIQLPDANDVILTNFEAVPEPATLGVFGLAGLAALVRKRFK